MRNIDFYKKANKAEMAVFAKNYFIDTLIDKNLSGEQKAVTTGALNLEPKVGTNLVPSMFYTFTYVSKLPEKLNKRTFFDAIPLIMCLHTDAANVHGLNFNMVPCDVRAVLLDIIEGTNKKFYTEDVYNGKLVNEPLARALMNEEKRAAIIDRMSDVTGVDIPLACRTYKKASIRKLRFIEYDMLHYIPFLVFPDSLRGLGLAELQKAMALSNRK